MSGDGAYISSSSDWELEQYGKLLCMCETEYRCWRHRALEELGRRDALRTRAHAALSSEDATRPTGDKE